MFGSAAQPMPRDFYLRGELGFSKTDLAFGTNYAPDRLRRGLAESGERPGGVMLGGRFVIDYEAQFHQYRAFV